MNITLSIDEKVAEEARRAAQGMGMSLNQAVRHYLERLAGRERLEDELAAFRTSALHGGGRRRGWVFDRDELHQRADSAAKPARRARAPARASASSGSAARGNRKGTGGRP